jgi:hypothetical protein
MTLLVQPNGGKLSISLRGNEADKQVINACTVIVYHQDSSSNQRRRSKRRMPRRRRSLWRIS